ncbi:hypothetical protein [Catellatospora sichuanensis]|uniref:hypothetical protein n=1 Tax=Catellatospora sichuanensis TaxID=1969805 RepID=UPI0011831332|nr:hypothetical protein [Catellatospora sichuanensis]
MVTPWSEVEDIFCAQVDERVGLPVHGPVLRLGGALMPLRTLGSYSLTGAQARVDQLRGLMPPTRTPALGA